MAAVLLGSWQLFLLAYGKPYLVAHGNFAVDHPWQLILCHGRFHFLFIMSIFSCMFRVISLTPFLGWQLIPSTFLSCVHVHAFSVFVVYMFYFCVFAGTPEEITPSMDEALRKAEQDALSRKSSGNQGQSSSGAREDAASDDVIRSATPGSVKHARVVHPPLEDDYQPTFRATREQCVFYDIIRRYGNARSNSKHFKQIRK